MTRFTSRDLAEIISERRPLSFREYVDLVDFLSDSIDCWQALQNLAPRRDPWEPETGTTAVVRALRRVLHPRCDLTLSSCHLRQIQVRELQLPSHLDRLRRHPCVIYRLSGLFHKARFVAHLQHGGSGGLDALALDIAEELTRAAVDIEQLADRYSQAMYHQLLAELQETSDVAAAAANYHQALRIFADLRLARRYRGALRRLFYMPGLPQSTAEKYLKLAGRRATQAFTRAEVRKLLLAIPSHLNSKPTRIRFFESINLERWFPTTERQAM